MRKEVILIFLGIFVISLVSAGQTYCVIPQDMAGNYQPNTVFSYQLNFTTNLDCSGVEKSFVVTAETNSKGVDCFELDLSGITNSKYFCEYKNGALRKIHNVSDAIFNNIQAQSIDVVNNVSADYFKGDGSELTGLPIGGNLSWNESYADGLYAGIQWAYNETLATYNLYNEEWSSTYNLTYDSKVTDNESWSESYADGLYAGIQWAYNQTIETYNLYNAEWSSTYNATYDAKVTDNESWNETYANGLYAEFKWNYNQTLATYNLWNDAWSSTYNATYDAKVTDNESWNETYAYSKFVNGTINGSQMKESGGIISIITGIGTWFQDAWDTIWGTKDTDDLTEGTTNVYDNQTWNQSQAEGLYGGSINNESYLSTYNATYDAKVSMDYTNVAMQNESNTFTKNQTMTGTRNQLGLNFWSCQLTPTSNLILTANLTKSIADGKC